MLYMEYREDKQMSWRIKYFILTIIAACIVTLFAAEYILDEKMNEQKSKIIEIKPEKVEAKKVPVSSALIKMDIEEMVKIIPPEEIIPKTVSLGEFKLTAYCSCEKCCDGWARNRPIDKDGNEIVYGSIGEELIEGMSIAVDPKVIPYGTKVIINDNTYVAQDTGGAIKGNRIDVYHNDHQKAREFAVQYAEVFKVVE